MKKPSKKIDSVSVLRFLTYLLPCVLFFSYYPIISFGSDESMNFEISLPLIWLVIFDVMALCVLAKRRMLKGVWQKWMWLLFPLYVTLSVVWSLNFVRGSLTVGILWMIYFAGFAFWKLKDLIDVQGFREKFWRVFFGAALVVCGWCLAQCILDICGVGREYTLMCAGCTYKMFGFPHPNGFAIEPQFMGHVLIAPSIISAYMIMNKLTLTKDAREDVRPSLWFLVSAGLVFLLSATLFLTFSRGAIYAFVVAIMFMSGFVIMRAEKWKATMKRVCVAWGIIALSFLFTLNLQGIMAALGPTTDAYGDGIAKALNHLSLGAVDLRNNENGVGNVRVVEDEAENNEPVENSVENFEEDRGKEAVFDGYVAESTDTRVKLTESAIKVWSGDFKTAVFGVGIGGAGWALYENGLSSSPKEIVQNEYASLLLETGAAGMILLILTLVLVVWVMMKNSASGMLLALLMAYGVTLLFFSGLPNALQIYLLPMVIMIAVGGERLRKAR